MESGAFCGISVRENKRMRVDLSRPTGDDIMIVGRVIGSIVSTRKCENLIGNKFMIIEPLEEMSGSTARFVAIDNIGAGIGETVLVATGSAARVGMENAPVDAAIVGIVDE